MAERCLFVLYEDAAPLFTMANTLQSLVDECALAFALTAEQMSELQLQCRIRDRQVQIAASAFSSLADGTEIRLVHRSNAKISIPEPAKPVSSPKYQKTESPVSSPSRQLHTIEPSRDMFTAQKDGPDVQKDHEVGYDEHWYEPENPTFPTENNPTSNHQPPASLASTHSSDEFDLPDLDAVWTSPPKQLQAETVTPRQSTSKTTSKRKIVEIDDSTASDQEDNSMTQPSIAASTTQSKRKVMPSRISSTTIPSSQPESSAKTPAKKRKTEPKSSKSTKTPVSVASTPKSSRLNARAAGSIQKEEAERSDRPEIYHWRGKLYALDPNLKTIGQLKEAVAADIHFQSSFPGYMHEDMHALNWGKILQDDELLDHLGFPSNLQVLYKTQVIRDYSKTKPVTVKVHLRHSDSPHSTIEVDVYPHDGRQPDRVTAVWDRLLEQQLADPHRHHLTYADNGVTIIMFNNEKIKMYLNAKPDLEISVVDNRPMSVRIGYRVRNLRKVVTIADLSHHISIGAFRENTMREMFGLSYDEQKLTDSRGYMVGEQDKWDGDLFAQVCDGELIELEHLFRDDPIAAKQFPPTPITPTPAHSASVFAERSPLTIGRRSLPKAKKVVKAKVNIFATQ